LFEKQGFKETLIKPVFPQAVAGLHADQLRK